MTAYRVEQDGKTVWTGESATCEAKPFPAEWAGRPESGVVLLFVDDVLIGRQISLADEEAEMAAAAAEGKG